MSAVRSVRVIVVLVALGVLVARPAAAQWKPPLGIPSPSFGVNEAAHAVPNPWTVAMPGFYYVDQTIAGNTDSNNPYGTPAQPRNTIPTTLPAGAVVELHGTYNFVHASPNTIVAQGTRANPVFIRGVSAANRPYAQQSWEIQGTYAVIENIEFGPTPDLSASGSLVILLPSSYIALRSSELHGTLTDGGLGIVQWVVPYGQVYTGSLDIDNVVIYNNYIHDNGDMNSSSPQHIHGISVSDHVNTLWVVDNVIARNSGDGIQINAQVGQNATTHHIYVGRNSAYGNGSNGFWTKYATDVIFSQNDCYGHRPSNTGIGQCMGAQYAPDWVWFLFNHVHDSEYGITQMSDNGEVARTFIIGNVIENIHASQASDPTSGWGPSAVMIAGGSERHVINNTIYNVDSGVNDGTTAGTLEVADNIISDITQAGASHILLDYGVAGTNTTMHHDLLFGDPRVNWGNGQVHLTAAQLAMVQSLGTDPLFVNAAGGDFHIMANSPAKGTGELNAVYGTFMTRYGVSIATDKDGNPRPQVATTDMGAYLAGGSAGGTPPTISTIGNHTANENSTSGAIAFTVADAQTPAASLTVSGSSSNTALVPNANLIFGGSGANRTVTVTPAANQFGTATITITVSDGTFTASTSFVLTVNAVSLGPTISAIPNQLTTVNKPHGSIAFTVTDGLIAASTLTVSGTSSNGALVPSSNLIFGGSGMSRTLTIIPAVNRTGTATITVGVSDGSLSASTSFTLTVPALGDLNGDGRADVVLRNNVTGQVTGWLMSGLTESYSASLPTVTDTNWEIKGIGDLNGDGMADLIWRHKVTGQVVGWLMNGLTVSNSASLPTVADTNWEIKGIGDLDGDGKADVIWRHKVTGQVVGWLMHGLTVSNSAFLPTVDPNWDIKAIGDLDGDGKADLIWRHAVTGQNVGWLMNGLTLASSALLPTVADTNWEIAGIGDLNGDGMADLIWRHAVTGQNVGWLMHGLTVSNSASLPTVADTNWELTGTGDLDGDSKADVIWRHAVTGQIVGWLMNGLTLSNSAFLPTVTDVNWEIVGR